MDLKKFKLGEEVCFGFGDKLCKGTLRGIREISFNNKVTTICFVTKNDTIYLVPEKDLTTVEPDYQEMYFKGVKESAAQHQKNMSQDRTIQKLKNDLESTYEKKVQLEKQLLTQTSKVRQYQTIIKLLEDEVDRIKVSSSTVEGAAFISGINYALDYLTGKNKKCTSEPQKTL